MIVAILVVLVVALVFESTARAEPLDRPGPNDTTIQAAGVSTWQCQDHLGVTRTKRSRMPLPRNARAYRSWVLNTWVVRGNECRVALAEKKRQWNWQAFPSWIIRLARCESSINWFAEGSSGDGVFYSAFNISRSQYDKDAHHMGVRGWHEGPGVPSPYEQAMAVIGHMRLLGDGFTGRCHGIARSSWS